MVMTMAEELQCRGRFVGVTLVGGVFVQDTFIGGDLIGGNVVRGTLLMTPS